MAPSSQPARHLKDVDLGPPDRGHGVNTDRHVHNASPASTLAADMSDRSAQRREARTHGRDAGPQYAETHAEQRGEPILVEKRLEKTRGKKSAKTANRASARPATIGSGCRRQTCRPPTNEARKAKKNRRSR